MTTAPIDAPKLSPRDSKDLPKLAQHLLAHGPHKAEPARRRIRAVHAGHVLADTLQAQLVWEHPYFPGYFVPRDALSADLSIHVQHEYGTDAARATLATLQLADAKVPDVLLFAGADLPALDGLVRIPFANVDQWLEEDAPVAVHPKDPYKRVDLLLNGSRPVRVSVGGTVLAESGAAVHLLETGLPTRYYLPLAAVRDFGMLRKSDTTTACPYKGVAHYYDVVLPSGETLKDLIWYYPFPTLECAGVAGMLCFYNEKVDIDVGGVRQ